jgi:propionyl-CoA carboxylase alpha chain
VLHGTTTNRDLLVAVLRDDAFLAGDTTTAYLDASTRRAAARVLATIPSGFTNTAAFDPEVRFTVAGEERTVRYRAERDGSWSVQVLPAGAGDDATPAAGEHAAPERRVLVHAAGRDGRLDLEVDGHRQRVRVVGGDGDLQVLTASARVLLAEQPRFPDQAGEEVAGATLAPMPGSVVTVAVAPGQRVNKGELLVTVEAMKMEHRVTAPFDGAVAEVRVEAGQQVDADQVLVVVEEPDGG